MDKSDVIKYRSLLDRYQKDETRSFYERELKLLADNGAITYRPLNEAKKSGNDFEVKVKQPDEYLYYSRLWAEYQDQLGWEKEQAILQAKASGHAV